MTASWALGGVATFLAQHARRRDKNEMEGVDMNKSINNGENERKMKEREQLLRRLTGQNRSKLSITAARLTQSLSAAGAATVEVCDK